MKIPILTLFADIVCMILSVALPVDFLAGADASRVGGTLLLHFA